MSMTHQTLIIAEAGVNHNGDLLLAKQVVDAACKAGADVVKFQTFQASKLTTKHAEQAAYQKLCKGTSQSQLEMLQRLELQPSQHGELIGYCRGGIEFLPLHLSSIKLLQTNLKRWKVPSGEITNLLIFAKLVLRVNLSSFLLEWQHW